MQLHELIAQRREMMGLSQNELAELAGHGVKQQDVDRIEKGITKTSKHLAFILDATGITADDVAALSGERIPLLAGRKPTPEILGPRDLPVFSAVEGGPGEMVVSTEPIEWVPRPWFLREVKEGYAVVVTGESMVPVYEPGDIVIVNPRLPAIRNKNAIFVSGEERGEFKATVKRLERSTTKEWHVKQWNPPDGSKQEFSLAKTEWPKALRIVGKYEGG